jgi:hypothetical protein
MLLRFDDVIANTDHIIRVQITKDDDGEIHLSIRRVNSGEHATSVNLQGVAAKEEWYELSVLCQNSIKKGAGRE